MRDVPIYLFVYHKVATLLMLRTFDEVCHAFDWRFAPVYGKCESVPTDADVLLFFHSMVDLHRVNTPYTGMHIIRDPRDIIVSGYLYHMRCDEKWCVNENLDTSEPVHFPQVPRSQEYRPNEWKQEYLRSLNNKSYQQNLQALSQRDGLLFEMQHYGGWTVKSMTGWNYHNPRILELRFETLMAEYDATFLKLFRHFGFSEEQTTRAMHIARKRDMGRMSDAQIEAHPHITSRQHTKWQNYFEDVHKETFKTMFGDVLIELGYETDNNW
jgi:hypothetical protein